MIRALCQPKSPRATRAVFLGLLAAGFTHTLAREDTLTGECFDDTGKILRRELTGRRRARRRCGRWGSDCPVVHEHLTRRAEPAPLVAFAQAVGV